MAIEKKMKLVVTAALLAICQAAKLDRTYLPPKSAATAGGSPGSLQTPFSRSTTGQTESQGSLPTGSYTNDFEAVVVDAATAGTRASDGEQSGLGGPRESYGSENSKVGEAAFRGSIAGFRGNPTLSSSEINGPSSGISAGQNFGSFESKSERPQAFRDRNSNIINYANDVSLNNYNYGFETDNGIAVGENGVADNGIKAQGGYSYKGDDGQFYKVTYVADEGGYRPQGDHLPTPPPIPQDILESLKQNAKEEAAGIVDDGSYDAQKYNAEGDYTHYNDGNNQYNGAQLSQFAKRPESDATASNTFINQNSQVSGKPGQLGNTGALSTHLTLTGQSKEHGTNYVNNRNDHSEFQDKQSSHIVNEHQQKTPTGLHSFGYFGQNSGGQSNLQLNQNQGSFGNQNAQFSSPNDQQAPASGSQSTKFGSQTNQHGDATVSGSQTNQVNPASQHEAEPERPSLVQNLNSAFTSLNQRPQFGSLAQTQNGFRQPSQYNENKENSQAAPTLFENANTTKPLFNGFDSKDPSAIGQSQTFSDNRNSFPNSLNQFGAEYLSPSNFTNGLTQNLPQSSSASAFASVGPKFETQPVKPFNTFQTDAFTPDRINYNNQFTSHMQSKLNVLPISPHHSGSHAISDGIKPTSIPNSELTTPLELYEHSDFNIQYAPSMADSGSKFSNYQSQSQIGFQTNLNKSLPSMTQTSISNFSDSRPQGTSQINLPPITPATQATQMSGLSEQNSQFLQNVINKNQENNAYYSTDRPLVSQNSDNSYYYNQPLKPFATPTVTQGTRLPNIPFHQSNGIATSQTNQQGSETSSSNIPTPTSDIFVSPTTSSQFSQTQGSVSNTHNGITQASISSFPSVPFATSSLFGYNQVNKFQSKPNSKLPSQSNKPTFSSQNSNVSNFQPNYVTTFGQQSSSSPIQTEKAQSSLNGNNFQNSLRFYQITNEEKSKPTETSSKQQVTSNQALQYQGTIYEYNKPAEVLPTPDQELNNFAMRPQFQSPQTQFGQSALSSNSLSHQNSLKQGSKTQHSPQSRNPFGSLPSISQFGHSIHSNLPQNIQESQNSVQPVEPTIMFSPQFSTNFGTKSKPQVSSQPYKSFGSSFSPVQFGQNTQQPQGTSHTSGLTASYQANDTHNDVQPFEPLGGALFTATQYGHKPQHSSVSSATQNSEYKLAVQPNNKPESNLSLPQFESQSFASLNDKGQKSNLSSQLFNPLGTSKGFQKYTTSNPQFGSQTLFTQNSQQTSKASQISLHPNQKSPVKDLPNQSFGNVASIYGSPNFPQSNQNIQLNQGMQPSGQSFDQQAFHSSQFSSSALKPQLEIQTQFGLNQNASPIKPLGNSPGQFIQTSATASSSTGNQQQSQSEQAYNPFRTSSNQGSSYTQNKSQFDQSPQPTLSTSSSLPQLAVQPFNPFSSFAAQSQDKPESSLSKSSDFQQSIPCCQSSKGSSIVLQNASKPSQASSQTHGQTTRFQGTQTLNAQSVAGKGEEFGGPRKPPSFDAQTGYHY